MDPKEQTDELISLFKYLHQLVKNPLESIKTVPKIHFSTLLVFQFILCAVSVVISNLLAPYAINGLTILVSVVGSFLGLSVLSLLFYYFFSIFFSRELSFRSLFALILFCHIPFAICHFLYYFFPVIDLFGFALTCLLMVVGLVENYQISKKASIKVMSTIYGLFFVLWIVRSISTYEIDEHSLPQSLDSIEKELQSSRD